jgi:hypothetical protein
MEHLITHKSPNDFFKYNRDFIYDNYFIHYHIIIAFEKARAKELDFFDAYNIIDDDGSFVFCLWISGAYYLYSFKWTPKILDMLSTKIEVSKATSRFSFMGQKDLILALFYKYSLPYKIFKDRLVYTCDKVSLSDKVHVGTVQNANFYDFDELVQMGMDNNSEEYEGKGTKTIEQMRYDIAHGITNDKLFIIKDHEEICSMVQVINDKGEQPMIGNLFTKKGKRNKGFAYSLLYVVTEGLLATGSDECGLLSDITNIASNKAFVNVGYKPIYNWASVHRPK